MGNKKCSSCELNLPLEVFVKNKSKKDGIGNICKSCNKIYHRKYVDSKKEIKTCEDLPEEKWKEVPNFEGYYLASNKSRIKSLPNRARRHREMILNRIVNTNGYRVVTLVKEGVRYSCRTHVLFAILFIPNPSCLPVVNHKNCQKDDDSLNNLEWTTSKGNTDHAFANGLMNNLIGENSNFSKLSNNQMIEISKSDKKTHELANQYGVTKECIYMIKSGKNCSFITGIQYVRKRKLKS